MSARASQVRLRVRMGDGHIYLIRLPAVSRTRLLIPHFIPFLSPPSLGDVTQLRLPDSMRSLNLSGRHRNPMQITGTCKGNWRFILTCGPAARAPHSSFSFFLSFPTFFIPRRSMLFLSGDLTQWHLPVGMKRLDLTFTEVTGKTTSE